MNSGDSGGDHAEEKNETKKKMFSVSSLLVCLFPFRVSFESYADEKIDIESRTPVTSISALILLSTRKNKCEN